MLCASCACSLSRVSPPLDTKPAQATGYGSTGTKMIKSAIKNFRKTGQVTASITLPLRRHYGEKLSLANNRVMSHNKSLSTRPHWVTTTSGVRGTKIKMISASNGHQMLMIVTYNRDANHVTAMMRNETREPRLIYTVFLATNNVTVMRTKIKLFAFYLCSPCIFDLREYEVATQCHACLGGGAIKTGTKEPAQDTGSLGSVSDRLQNLRSGPENMQASREIKILSLIHI